MKSDYISRSALEKRLTFLAVSGKDSQQRTFAKCLNEVGLAPDAQMWIDPKRALPENDNFVLAIANGTPRENIEFRNAFVLVTYAEDGGWIVDGYEEWENPQIDWWMPLPVPPEEDV